MNKQYIAFHKPYGVLSQFTGEANQRTLAEFKFPKGVYAAGRLDKDSEGLLLLTDDGPLKHKLLHPNKNHKKTFLDMYRQFLPHCGFSAAAIQVR